MPGKSPHVKNEKQYEALKNKGMSKERAAKIANSPGASHREGRPRDHAQALVDAPDSKSGANGYRCRRGAWRSLVSALVWGTRGRQFESARPDWKSSRIWGCGRDSGVWSL